MSAEIKATPNALPAAVVAMTPVAPGTFSSLLAGAASEASAADDAASRPPALASLVEPNGTQATPPAPDAAPLPAKDHVAGLLVASNTLVDGDAPLRTQASPSAHAGGLPAAIGLEHDTLEQSAQPRHRSGISPAEVAPTDPVDETPAAIVVEVAAPLPPPPGVVAAHASPQPLDVMSSAAQPGAAMKVTPLAGPGEVASADALARPEMLPAPTTLDAPLDAAIAAVPASRGSAAIPTGEQIQVVAPPMPSPSSRVTPSPPTASAMTWSLSTMRLVTPDALGKAPDAATTFVISTDAETASLSDPASADAAPNGGRTPNPLAPGVPPIALGSTIIPASPTSFASAGTTPTSLTLDAPPELIAADLARELSALVEAGDRTATIRLRPATLGDLTVAVELGAERVAARLTVETAGASAALTGALDQLRAQFAAGGLRLDAVAIDLAGGGANGGSARDGRRETAHDAGPAIKSAANNPQAARQGRPAQGGRIDVYA